MSNTLLVWENVPETTEFYLIPNDLIDQNGWLPLFKEAHGKFINSDDWCPGLEFINAALCSPEFAHEEESDLAKEWLYCLHSFKVDPKNMLDNVDVSRVVLSGMIM
jgi:hypothetical protein